ncbi:MAG TPA: hypothetical protein VKA95_06875 [Nitrososphaeraceae archaeon]|nr:hypothetical protein [Nitrososphaeraceae archaeon]
MSLFNEDRLGNLLPKNGTVNYYGEILASKEANKYLDSLRIKHQKYNQHL